MEIENALGADLRLMEVIARNAANVTTDGYQRARGVQSFDAYLRLAEPEQSAVQVIVDRKPGMLHRTGRPLDFAIDGKGYFEVEGQSGPLYSRDGKFVLNDRGELVTRDGYPVVGTEGRIVVTQGPLELGSDGELRDNGRSLGRLKCVAPLEPNEVRPEHGSYISFGQREELVSARVRQGFAEASNVDMLAEMMHLLEVSRHFEMAQRVLVSRDALVGESVRKIGEF